MPEKKSSKLEKIKLYLAVFVVAASAVGVVLTVDRHFAKSDDVQKTVKSLEGSDQLIEERLDLSIIDDQIHLQEQQIQRIEDWRVFEQKTESPELTPAEKEIVEKAKEDLDELKKKKDERRKQYEEMRKKK